MFTTKANQTETQQIMNVVILAVTVRRTAGTNLVASYVVSCAAAQKIAG